MIYCIGAGLGRPALLLSAPERPSYLNCRAATAASNHHSDRHGLRVPTSIHTGFSLWNGFESSARYGTAMVGDKRQQTELEQRR